MKVCIFSNLYHPNIIGGAERSAQLLAEGLLKAGLHPFVITIADRNYQDYVNGIKIYYIPYSNLFWKYRPRHNVAKRLIWHLVDVFNIFILNHIRKILEEEKPDIAHTNNISGFSVALWRLLRKRNIPIVHTLRDYYLICVNSSMFRSNRNCLTPCTRCRFFSMVKKEMTDCVDAVVGVSHSILHRHLNLGYFGHTRIKSVVYNAIPQVPRKPKKDKLNSKIHFGFMGTLARHKGVELILKVFSAMDGAELFLYGKSMIPGYEDYLRGKYGQNNIRFMGFQPMEDALPNIDITIVPSLWYEPFSRVVVESYYYGIPVIASRQGGPLEIVEEGKTGFLFSTDRDEELVAIVRRIIENPASLSDLKDNCLRKSEEFTLDKHIDRYVAIYTQILMAGSHP